MEIKDRIKLIRKKLKLNQLEFGKRIGVTESAICNFENARRNPSEQTLKSICREYNVDYFWLTEGGNEDEMFLPEPTGVIDELKVQYNLSDTETKIIENFLKLSKSQREDFIETMKHLFNLNT